jgi:hypothetical protein
MKPVTWVLESEVFPQSHTSLREAIVASGHRLLSWNDDWWSNDGWPALADSAVVFHGSLGNAAAIFDRLQWRPGAYCNTERFRCSSWYDRARQWLLHRDWRILPADQFVGNADSVFDALGCRQAAFVRPDSPLKPFSGRVLQRGQVTLDALDYGFYFDDPTIPVVVAPVCVVGQEWRFVVVTGEVVAGSRYDAETRTAIQEAPTSAAWEFAMRVAKQMEPPEDVHVLDVCESDGHLRLLELNPFSGADLYACESKDVVAAVSSVVALGGQRP